MKRCFKCSETLPLSQFYRHPSMADGHLGKCKSCTCQDVRENYARNRNYYIEYDRRRYRNDPVKRTPKPRAPEKRRALWAVHNAIRDKRLAKLSCEVCGETKVDAHHPDYSEPLKVRWLCRTHHGEVHRMP